MTKFADLHIHTHFSDSTSSPEEVVRQAVDKGLSCIAITDHDTVDGIDPTIKAAQGLDLEVIPGIELSTEAGGKDIHILAYLFDYQNPGLIEHLRSIQNSRVERMRQMITKLKDLGVGNIDLDEVCALAKSKAVGRPHLAAILCEHGLVKTRQEAFQKYLADGAAAYVPKQKQTPQEAIELIKSLGGITVLAHPMVTAVDEMIPEFVRYGLGGIEVYYPNTLAKLCEYYERLARKHKIIATGGSDAHGDAKKNTFVGKMKVPYETVERMKQIVKESAQSR